MKIQFYGQSPWSSALKANQSTRGRTRLEHQDVSNARKTYRVNLKYNKIDKIA